MRQIVTFLLLMVMAPCAQAQWFSGPAGVITGKKPGPPPPFITAISPTSQSIPDNTASGTTVVQFACTMSDNSTCPPPGGGYVWSISNAPSFLTINPSTGLLTTTRALTSADDGSPTFDSYTFSVSIQPLSGPTVSSVAWPGSPAALAISTTAAIGSFFQFTCTMSDSSPCTGQNWSFSNQPAFLTSGQNNTGGTLTVNAAPTVGSGTLTATAGGFSQSVPWVVAAPTVASISPTSLSISDQSSLGTQFQFTCTMSDNSACTNQSWSSSNVPSFLTAGQNSTGLILTTNQPPPLTDTSGCVSGCPNPAISVTAPSSGAPSPQVASIAAPTALSPINVQSPQGTVLQFTCTTADGSPCTGKNWSFSNVPTFLTPGVNWKGGTLTVNQPPPLPINSGNVGVAACDTSEPGCVPQPLPPISAPCDIYASTGTPCVAAHSTVRALYGSYSGPLYQIQRASDGTLLDVGLLNAGGIVNAAAQDTFCASTSCQFTIIYDQSQLSNHLIPNGGNSPASTMPITINGHKAYGIWTNSSGSFTNVWEDRGAVGTPGSDAPGTLCTVQRCAQGVYMVSTSQHVTAVSGGYFWGTCENEQIARGLGTCHVLRWTVGCFIFNPPGCGYPAGSTGPWIAVDFEGGDYYSDQAVDQNPADVGTTNTFVTLMSSVDGVATWNRKTGNAQIGALTTWFSGPTPVFSCSIFQPCSPCANCYTPLTLEGGIILGQGGDGTNGDSGIFFEGAITRGRPSDTVDNAIQANIVAAGYTSIP